MFSIPIKDDIISHCRDLLKYKNFGQRGIADGNASEQLRGIVGQSVIHDLLGLPLIEDTGGFDGGIDFIHQDKSYDVKTMGRNCDPKHYFVNNLIGLQDKYKVDRYIFCSINRQKLTITVCGWIDKQDFFNKAKFFPEGMTRTRDDGSTFIAKTDLYELANSELNQSNNIDEFLKQLIV